MNNKFTWARWTNNPSYEVSSQGDSRFSALFAKMPDGRTIEMWYQCDVKGFDPGGTNWREGKGKLPLHGMTRHTQWDLYLSIWKLWAIRNPELMVDLLDILNSKNIVVLKDRFTMSDINQARALATILNEWVPS